MWWTAPSNLLWYNLALESHKHTPFFFVMLLSCDSVFKILFTYLSFGPVVWNWHGNKCDIRLASVLCGERNQCPLSVFKYWNVLDTGPPNGGFLPSHYHIVSPTAVSWLPCFVPSIIRKHPFVFPFIFFIVNRLSGCFMDVDVQLLGEFVRNVIRGYLCVECMLLNLHVVLPLNQFHDLYIV